MRFYGLMDGFQGLEEYGTFASVEPHLIHFNSLQASWAKRQASGP